MKQKSTFGLPPPRGLPPPHAAAPCPCRPKALTTIMCECAHDFSAHGAGRWAPQRSGLLWFTKTFSTLFLFNSHVRVENFLISERNKSTAAQKRRRRDPMRLWRMGICRCTVGAGADGVAAPHVRCLSLFLIKIRNDPRDGSEQKKKNKKPTMNAPPPRSLTGANHLELPDVMRRGGRRRTAVRWRDSRPPFQLFDFQHQESM